MLFLELDLGEYLRKEIGLASPTIMGFLIGNPLMMKEMAKHVPDAGSDAPVTVLIDERADGVHLDYDKMASLLAPYGSPEVVPSLGNWMRKSRASFKGSRLQQETPIRRT